MLVCTADMPSSGHIDHMLQQQHGRGSPISTMLLQKIGCANALTHLTHDIEWHIHPLCWGNACPGMRRAAWIKVPYEVLHAGLGRRKAQTDVHQSLMSCEAYSLGQLTMSWRARHRRHIGLRCKLVIKQNRIKNLHHTLRTLQGLSQLFVLSDMSAKVSKHENHTRERDEKPPHRSIGMSRFSSESCERSPQAR